MRDWTVMRFAPSLAVALATAVGVGVLISAPAGAMASQPAVIAAAPSTEPPIPTLSTTVPLPTQSTSLTPVSPPVTSAPAINDEEATQLVNRIVLALIGLGVLVALLTFWYWRSTKPVPPALEGLDLMSSRKWLRGKPDKRSRLLGEYRAKRGPVPEESIARVGAPTVRVGAAVAAPVPAMAVAPAQVSQPGGPAASTGASPQAPVAPEAAGLAELTDEPPVVLVSEDDDAPGGQEPGTSPPSPQPAPPQPTPGNGDADSVFTVVARRPRNDGTTGSQPEST